jgi:hypothetical protein
VRRTLSDGPSPEKPIRNQTISRPGLFATRAFRRSFSRLYTEISVTFEEDDEEENKLGFIDKSRIRTTATINWGYQAEQSCSLTKKTSSWDSLADTIEYVPEFALVLCSRANKSSNYF